ncbi:permease [Clostridium massiliodielmoense]|uniref:permease n=1 Tax=Clostridium massiliodielmoense TaxID=1776385 RepID=UPI000A268BED|nr:permease [Clostridium massiliodielmoense]
MNTVNSKTTAKEYKICKSILILVLCIMIFQITTLMIDSKVIFFQNFCTIFTSILLEGVPFILIGSFISSLIQVFVSEEVITRIIPKNRFLGLILASLVGLIFPVCECAIVPITKKLVKKGVPLGIAFTFMLSVPIVNPIVIMSTYYAFYNKISIFIIRCVGGVLASILIGYIISLSECNKNGEICVDKPYEDSNCGCGCNSEYNMYTYNSKIKLVLNHTISELFSITKYLAIGAFLSTIFQLTVSKQSIAFIGKNPLVSVIAMMILAFVLSVCSEADAFIARTFLNEFTMGSISAFLILGPMIDIKNAIMLFGNFKKTVVMKLIFYIFGVCYLIGILVNIFERLGVI